MLAVTIDSLPGYDIVKVIGQVLGISARCHNAFIEGTRSMPGLPRGKRLAALGEVRREAIELMLDTAYQRGANAVIGMRFDHRPVNGSWIEVCAYGTAVLVTPMRSQRR
ncbi:MAG: heavy metal-binding domain-containing protein [Micromonosporaceae bacterium]|nr:heavy metal-binding domain-containing protein [Micromonosporaceae bacterium]